jgi:hypothetical protein
MQRASIESWAQPRLYAQPASWSHRLTRPEHQTEESAFYRPGLVSAASPAK